MDNKHAYIHLVCMSAFLWNEWKTTCKWTIFCVGEKNRQISSENVSNYSDIQTWNLKGNLKIINVKLLHILTRLSVKTPSNHHTRINSTKVSYVKAKSLTI